MAQTYGRNRESIADLDKEITDIFLSHPDVHINEEGDPAVPGDALVDIFRTFSSNHEALQLLTSEEEDQVISFIKSNPGIQPTPQLILKFIAIKTTSSPRHSPKHSPPPTFSDLHDRGREEQQPHPPHPSHSRSSSVDSAGTSVYRPPSRPPSRGPPVPPKTPSAPESPFDRRQRTTPLQNNAAPSSWSRRPPPSRRRSDAGSHSRALSDSESSMSSPPISFSHSYNGRSRSRTPSNPPSPSRDSYSSIPFARPHSRTQSQPQSGFNYAKSDSGSDHPGSPPNERDLDFDMTIQTRGGFGGLMSPPSSSVSDTSNNSFEYDDPYEDPDAQFASRISALPLPPRPNSRASHSSSEDEDEDFEHSMGRVLDHRSSMASMDSTMSLEDQEKMEALEKTNKDLARKLMESDRMLHNRMTDHETELVEMESKIEELKAELSATKREEKELRGKEWTLQNQISSAEVDIAKLQKALENAKLAYQSLQKQYAEQLAEAERTRKQLHLRNEDLKHAKENLDLQSLELQKWSIIQQNYDAQIQALQEELANAQVANVELDEQKQENLMLKETIDRMRFDMDEMRTNLVSANHGAASAKGSLSKSLGAEMQNMMNGMGTGWGMDHEDEDDDERVKELLEVDDDTEGEDVIQTIITRTKRKVASRAKRMETVNIEEYHETSDASIQTESGFGQPTSSVQTDPPPKILVAFSSAQTDPPPLSLSAEIQTDSIPEPPPPPPPPQTSSVEIQTNVPEEEEEEIPEEIPEASISTASVGTSTSSDDETLASSSSTILPPTPKSPLHDTHADHHHDLPPAYDQAAREDLALGIANETLKTWHKGLNFPPQPIEGGISEEAIEDWKALKEELGVECMAIDKLIEESEHSTRPRTHPSSATSKHRRSKFYNIYNTYVYGDRSSSSSGGAAAQPHHHNSILTNSQFLFVVGASAAVAYLMGHAMAPQYVVPGGATYYDRAAWESFNSVRMGGEGFPGDGVAATAALWSFIGRIGGGAARTLRGWPT